ncbi:MAG: DUF4221 family protein [Bacteroidetes bacterium]|nr:DUF4221 family protein [Bacteroidota bacterium]
MRKFIFSIFVLSIVFSCEKTDPFKYFSISNKEIIINDSTINYISGYLFETNDSLYLLNQDLNTRNIFCYNLINNKVFQLFEENNKHSISKSIFYQIYIKTFDSIFVLSLEKNLVSLINNKAEIQKEYHIPDSLTVAATPDFPLEVLNTNIHVGNTSKTINVSDKKNRKKYYQLIKPEIVIPVSQTDQSFIISQLGAFPEHYFESGNDYSDYFPTRCMNKEGGMIFSYDADHYIYVFDSDGMSYEKPCESKYIKTINHIPDNKTLDMAYSRKFQLEEPKYERIYYDKYRNRYYRIVKHRSKVENGQMTDIENFTWSIIVLDENLDILGEQIFYFKNYNYQIFYPAKEGIYINKTNSEQHDRTIRLTLLEI